MQKEFSSYGMASLDNSYIVSTTSRRLSRLENCLNIMPFYDTLAKTISNQRGIKAFVTTELSISSKSPYDFLVDTDAQIR